MLLISFCLEVVLTSVVGPYDKKKPKRNFPAADNLGAASVMGIVIFGVWYLVRRLFGNGSTKKMKKRKGELDSMGTP